MVIWVLIFNYISDGYMSSYQWWLSEFLNLSYINYGYLSSCPWQNKWWLSEFLSLAISVMAIWVPDLSQHWCSSEFCTLIINGNHQGSCPQPAMATTRVTSVSNSNHQSSWSQSAMTTTRVHDLSQQLQPPGFMTSVSNGNHQGSWPQSAMVTLAGNGDHLSLWPNNGSLLSCWLHLIMMIILISNQWLPPLWSYLEMYEQVQTVMCVNITNVSNNITDFLKGNRKLNSITLPFYLTISIA